MKIKVKAEREVEPHLLKVHCKVRDDFTASLVTRDGEVLKDQEDGYVPEFMPGDHYGDYVILDIDIKTGQITNWREPSPDALRRWINGGDED